MKDTLQIISLIIIAILLAVLAHNTQVNNNHIAQIAGQLECDLDMNCGYNN